MGKLKLRGQDLINMGFPEGPAIGTALGIAKQHFPKSNTTYVLAIFRQLLEEPERYAHDPVLAPVVKKLQAQEESKGFELLEEAGDYPVYGEEAIEAGAKKQMDTAMRLPIAVGGALMADAHQGYGLPIGGVLATKNTVIPYGVGVDIGCRMALTVYDLKLDFLENERFRLKKFLQQHTRFGFDAFEHPMDDEVLERPEFKEIKVVKSLKQRAVKQIGSSGSGNHFVEFGIAKITNEQNEFDLPVGEYVTILSHSGSRGLGANIAKHYTALAKKQCPLPREAQHLAWLDMDSEEGQEYWLAMNLAGDYASACHRHIHHRLAKALGEQPIARVENHHNFAWKERLKDGTEVIVHRKGATPAGKGVLGIIPGSMTAPGFIVRGKGNFQSLQSASHGAGRVMSRRQAKQNISFHKMRKHLSAHGVDLLGGGLDEAPFAYKNIQHVMQAQQDLVDVIGTFQPKIVRMDQG